MTRIVKFLLLAVLIIVPVAMLAAAAGPDDKPSQPSVAEDRQPVADEPSSDLPASDAAKGVDGEGGGTKDVEEEVEDDVEDADADDEPANDSEGQEEPAEAAIADDEKNPEPSDEQSTGDEASKDDAVKSDDDGQDDADDDDADDDDADDDDADGEDEDEAKSAKKPAKADKPKAKKRKTATVESKRLKVDVTLDATFIADEMTEIKIEPETWSTFEIEEVVEHGAKVAEGQTLLRFDREPLDEAIAELDLSLRMGEIAMQRAEAELPRLEKSLDMRLADAERSEGYAKEDYDEYKSAGRDQMVESSRMMLKQYRMYLDQARDELVQLEKMYEADDLTEETEEIVLKRQRQQVEVLEFYVKMIEYDTALSERLYFPRRDVSYDEALDRVGMSLAQARLAHKLDLNEARYRLEQRRKSREEQLERHADLIADRGLMTIKAPSAGVVYYGRCVKGKWSDLSSMLNKLLPSKSAPREQVIMTIVDPGKLHLYGTVGEKDVPSLKPQQAALVTPKATGAEPMRGSVREVSAVPVASGKYAVEITLASGELPAWLDPGMTGKAKVTTYDNPEALVVSKKAVHTDEFDETVKYVWLVTPQADNEADDEGDADEEEDDADADADAEDEDEEEDDAAEPAVEKRLVRVGHTKGDLIEILDGVSEGDVLSLEDEDKRKDKEG